MNAYELADAIEDWEKGANFTLSIKAGQMLRQQADRIAALELQLFKVTNRIIATRKKLSKLKKEKIRAYDNGYEDGQKAVAWISPLGNLYKSKIDAVKNGEQMINPLYTTPQIKELSDAEIKPLLDRIQNYLECGGLFNPECIKHDKVRDLIMDCKAILKKASEK